jgi:hypothetical protein
MLIEQRTHGPAESCAASRSIDRFSLHGARSIGCWAEIFLCPNNSKNLVQILKKNLTTTTTPFCSLIVAALQPMM